MSISLYTIPVNYDALYICGDIHGEFRTLIYNLKRYNIGNAVVVVAGDCGIGFEKPAHYDQLYRKLLSTLEKLNILILLVRGNHDNPKYFEECLINFPFMKTIPDYSVIQFKNHNILCIGGAVSIDRTLRKQQMEKDRIKGRTIRESFWENEAAVFNENKLIEISAKHKIDTVITHTAPSFCYPTGKRGIESWLKIDKPLEQDLADERAVMDRIYVWLKEKGHTVMEWFYGHFHDSSIEYISDTKFTLLNIDELKELM